MLDDFIIQEIQKPFVWKVTDCCSTSDRWVELNTGISPMKNSGFVFETEEEAREILKTQKSLLSACRKAMKDFKRTKSPKKGDIGIIKIFGNTICASIKLDEDFWFTRNENGIISVRTKPLIAWSICLKPSP